MGTYVPPAPPVVTASTPAAEALGVAADASVQVTFDQPVTGLSTSSFSLADAYGLRVSGSVTYSSGTRTATFTPSAPLESGMRYRVSLTNRIRSGFGVRLDAMTWRFTVAGSLAPSVTAYWPAAELALGIGTNTGYKFTVGGSMVASKHATLSQPVTATTTLRRTIANQKGTWFYVASGTWKGHWLRASTAVGLSGATIASVPEPETFSPARTVAIRPGTHTGYTFNAAGAMTSAKTRTVGYRQASTTELAELPGQSGQWFRVTSGIWRGYWLRASDVVKLPGG
jgi:hypothetical protein